MFNTTERVMLRFDKVSLKMNGEGMKIAKMRLAIPLTAEVAAKCPGPIRAAYEAVEVRDNKITYTELGKIAIPGVNIEFYYLPDSKALGLALQSITLDKLVVEREESKMRAETRLLVSIEIAIDEEGKLRHWLVDNVFNQLFAKFEVAQMSLMPSMGDGQADAPRVQ